jgi:hypothetical protein
MFGQTKSKPDLNIPFGEIMNKNLKYVLTLVAAVILIILGKTVYTKVELKSRENRINKLQEEARHLELINDYIGATEVYREINALREGRQYVRDRNPHATYEAELQATARMLIDYLQVLDTQIVDEGVTASIVMKVRNTYNKTMKGAVDIYLLDNKGKIVRTWIGMLPHDGIPPGQTALIHTPINKQKFSKIKIDGGHLREGY